MDARVKPAHDNRYKLRQRLNPRLTPLPRAS
jgi:hypothetical protein